MGEVFGLLVFIFLACYLASKSKKDEKNEKYEYRWFNSDK